MYQYASNCVSTSIIHLVNPCFSRPIFVLVNQSVSQLTLESVGQYLYESFKSRLSLIVRVNVVLNRTVVVDSD